MTKTNKTNDERADIADDALEVMQDDDRPSQICDLMVNLMHLANREGMCVNALMRRVQMHYDAEATDD
jgi:HEAT repeat protein